MSVSNAGLELGVRSLWASRSEFVGVEVMSRPRLAAHRIADFDCPPGVAFLSSIELSMPRLWPSGPGSAATDRLLSRAQRCST